ncbi:MAG: hypothetical protein ACE5GA_10995, partial [Candidatus Zixiibacteriota bacterium]
MLIRSFKRLLSLLAFCLACLAPAPAGAADYVCGDADSDASSRVNIAEVSFMIGRLFAGGPASLPFGASDPNCDGKANIADVNYVIAWLFQAGPAPCCPQRTWAYVNPAFVGFQDGSKSNPYTSLQQALTAGAPGGLDYVYLKNGIHTIPANLTIRVSLTGGLDNNLNGTSQRTTELRTLRVSGATARLFVEQPTSSAQLELSHLIISAPDETASGNSSNPLVIRNSKNVILINCQVKAGAILWFASPGSSGANGSSGNDGSAGANGSSGSAYGGVGGLGGNGRAVA